MSIETQKSIQQPYPEWVRQEAVRRFKSGYGYKATATILGIPSATVRDWRRKWVLNSQNSQCVPFDKALKEVMQERHMEYVWREQEDVLKEAYRRGAQSLASNRSRYGIMRVLIGISNSDLFEKLPISIYSNRKQYPVYKLR